MIFKLNHKYNRYLLVTFLLAIIAIFWRVILLSRYFDYSVGYYIGGSKLPIAYIAFMCISVAVFISAAFILNSRHIHFSLNKKYAYTVFARAFTGFVMILGFIMYLLENKIQFNLSFVCNLLLLPSAVYFIYPIFTSKPSKPICAFWGFFPIIWAILNLALVYFDSNIAINNPIKVTEQLTFMIVMLYFVYECRVYLKKPLPLMHCVVGMTAILLTATAGIAGIIIYGMQDASTYVIYDLIFTAICLYISSQFVANGVK